MIFLLKFEFTSKSAQNWYINNVDLYDFTIELANLTKYIIKINLCIFLGVYTTYASKKIYYGFKNTSIFFSLN